MAQPSDLALWASDTNFSSGTESGSPTKVDPGAAYEAQGGVPGQPFVAPYWNWALHNHGLWLQYLQNIDTDAHFLGQNYTWTATHRFTGSPRFEDPRIESGDLLYSNSSGVSTPRARSKHVRLTPAQGSTAPTGMWLVAGAGNIFASGAAADGYLELDLADGCTITEVLAGVQPSGGGIITLQVQRLAPDALSNAITLVTLGAVDTSSGTSFQVLTTGAIASNNVVANGTYRYRVFIGADNAGQNINWVTVSYTDPGFTGN